MAPARPRIGGAALSDLPDINAVLEQVGEHYWVSSEGEVWSTRRGRARKLKPSRNAEGYRTVGIYGKTEYVHTLILEAFIGPRPEGAVARHLNDEPGDDRLGNLAWGSRADNQTDAKRNGRTVGTRGERHGRARLTERDVHLMRSMREAGWLVKDLANVFDVAASTASHAISGRNWAHV